MMSSWSAALANFNFFFYPQTISIMLLTYVIYRYMQRIKYQVTKKGLPLWPMENYEVGII